MNNNRLANKITSVLLVIYLIVLSWILLLKFGVHFSYMENRLVNLIPFNELIYPTGKVSYSEIVLNVLIFIPLGIYFGVLFKRWTFAKKMLFFFLISLLFESLQFIFRIGAFDITDIITNTLGGLIGWLIWIGIAKILPNKITAQRIVNITATLATLLMIVLLTLLKLSMLPIRYQ